jgi:Domain of unknown function (DUF5666)
VIVVNIINWEPKLRAKGLLSLAAAILTSAGAFGVAAAGVSATPVSGLNFTSTVVGVGSGSFTVLRADQAVTVDVSPTTTYSEHGVTSASLSNVLIGERVDVQGSITSNLEVVDASHVQILQLLPDDFNGTVSSLGSGSFIALRGTSPINVDVSPKTGFSVAGAPATFSSLSLGDRVIVHGTSNPGGTVVNAAQVYITSFGSLEFTATVTSVGSSSFTVERINERVTVDVSSKTAYSERGVKSASFADVLMGQRVTVQATDTASSNVLDATHVQVTPLASMDITGTVSLVGTTSFTVLRGNSRVTIDVSAKTHYSKQGVTSPSLADVMPGDKVIVHGIADPGGTVINATQVYVIL